MRWVILNSTIFRRIMRRRDNNTVGQAIWFSSVVIQNRMRNNGRRRITLTFLDNHIKAISNHNFNRRTKSSLRQGMCIHSNKEWTIDALSTPVFTQCLANCCYMSLVERIQQRRTTMPRCTKANSLSWIIDIRHLSVISTH